MGQFEKGKEIVKSERIAELLAIFYPEIEEVEYLNFCEVQIAENPTRVHYGNRHLCLSETDLLEVYDCKKIEDVSTLRFVLSLRNDFLDVQIYYDYLKEIGVKYLYTGHCTGEKALEILKNQGGDMVQALASGLVIEL